MGESRRKEHFFPQRSAGWCGPDYKGGIPVRIHAHVQTHMHIMKRNLHSLLLSIRSQDRDPTPVHDENIKVGRGALARYFACISVCPRI